MNTGLALLLITMLAVSSLIMVESAFAQSIPEPSVPDFTLKLVDNSYDVPPIPPTAPTYTKDPYSGKQIILSPGSSGSPGYHVENKTIELWIKNQKYSYSNGSTTFQVDFDVRTKGHFGENWTETYPTRNLPTMRFNMKFNGAPAPYLISNPIQSNSDYTVLSFNGNYVAGDQVDFQVKAMIGHESQYYAGEYYGGNFIFHDYFLPAIAFDADSGWSNTQTLTIPAPTAETSGTSSPWVSPQTLQLGIIIGMIVIIIAVLLVYFEKHKHQS